MNGGSTSALTTTTAAKKLVKPKRPFVKGRFHTKISENERGISLEFGKFVALISISGEY